MSYSRSFTKTVSVHYSGSVSYPASEHGGTVSYSGTAYENVTVNILVDTTDFDRSVGVCSNSVGGLTGSIVATEAAQIKAIRDNSHKVGSTIVNGFYKTVQSEISQQIVELTTTVDSNLMHLRQLAEKCNNIQRQMQNDYSRLLSRYSKVFDDLNSELENRIFELCRPVFLFKRHTDERIGQAISGDMSSAAAVSGAESSVLEARIASSLAKRRASSTIQQANNFLAKQKNTERVLYDNTIDENLAGGIYLPVCYIETKDNGVTNRQAHKPKMLERVDSRRLVESIKDSDLQNELSRKSEHLEESFNREVASAFKTTNEHNQRVMDYITKLFYSNIKK